MTDVQALQRRVRELERALAKVTQERDDLEKDVENLCMNGPGNSTFTSSSVLSERIFSTEKELSRVKAQLLAVVEERDNMRDDLSGYRMSKHSVDSTLTKEMQKTKALEKELAFYQTQSARAMTDRDKAVWEAEELRGQMLALEASQREAESRLDGERTQRAELERQLRVGRETINRLEGEASESAKVPGLQRKLVDALDRGERLERENGELQAQLQAAVREVVEVQQRMAGASESERGAGERLEEAEAALEQTEAAYRRETAELKAEIEELKFAVEAAERRAEDVDGSLAAAQAELEEARRATDGAVAAAEARAEEKMEGLKREVERLQRACQDTQHELEEASSQKVAGLMRLSAEASARAAAEEERAALRRQVADLKHRLNQAAQEKVQALMQTATLKEEMAAAQKEASGRPRQPSSPTPSNAPTPRQPFAPPWKLWSRTSSDRGGESEARSPGAKSGGGGSEDLDLEAAAAELLRLQVAALQEKLNSVEGLAGSSRQLRHALQSAAAALEGNSRAGSSTASELDRIAKETSLLRSALYPDGTPADSAADLSNGKPSDGDLKGAPEVEVGREVVELLDFGVARVRLQLAARAT